MKANSVLPQRDGESLLAAIKCVILYEDFASGARAMHFAEMLAEGLESACDCESLWRIELMEFPEISDGVAREAATSDFVILALRGDRHLSFGFKRWLESWLTPSMDGGFSLIALFDSNRSTSHAASARYALREMSAGRESPSLLIARLQTTCRRPRLRWIALRRLSGLPHVLVSAAGKGSAEFP